MFFVLLLLFLGSTKAFILQAGDQARTGVLYEGGSCSPSHLVGYTALDACVEVGTTTPSLNCRMIDAQCVSAQSIASEHRTVDTTDCTIHLWNYFCTSDTKYKCGSAFCAEPEYCSDTGTHCYCPNPNTTVHDPYNTGCHETWEDYLRVLNQSSQLNINSTTNPNSTTNSVTIYNNYISISDGKLWNPIDIVLVAVIAVFCLWLIFLTYVTFYFRHQTSAGSVNHINRNNAGESNISRSVLANPNYTETSFQKPNYLYQSTQSETAETAETAEFNAIVDILPLPEIPELPQVDYEEETQYGFDYLNENTRETDIVPKNTPPHKYNHLQYMEVN